MLKRKGKLRPRLGREERSSMVKKKPSSMKINSEATDEVSGVNIRKVQATIDAMGNMFWKPDAGKHTIRILPPPSCFDGDFAVTQVLHYGFTDKEGKKRALACLRPLDQDCPICEFVEEMNGHEDKADKKIANDNRASTSMMCPVLVRPSKRVRIMRMPVTIYRKLASAMAEPVIGDFTDAKRGRDILITRTGTGMLDTRYDCQLLDRGPIGVEGWKRQMPNFEKLKAPAMSVERLRKMIARTYG